MPLSIQAVAEVSERPNGDGSLFAASRMSCLIERRKHSSDESS
ncbi:hypothetical protein M2418_002596 [Rhizobium sp. BIGb0125]|nr:hypothetical protein [Rhizobium sp. BIGb0125]